MSPSGMLATGSRGQDGGSLGGEGVMATPMPRACHRPLPLWTVLQPCKRDFNVDSLGSRSFCPEASCGVGMDLIFWFRGLIYG